MVSTVSISKECNGSLNEDAISTFPFGMAVSDGAGGGGLFAELWSEYLVKNIPCHPISTWTDLDNWLSKIWEKYYYFCENKATAMGGLALEKFYDEGSFATLSAVWFDKSSQSCNWLSYGDSVVFHYRTRNKVLEYSISSLESFNAPPHLINCKDSPQKEGLKSGVFKLHPDSIVFICSDALSHYILMMYYINHYEHYKNIIDNCVKAHTRNSTLIKTALHLRSKNFDKILLKLISSSKNKANFRRHVSSLERKGLLSSDDYTFGFMSL